MSVRVFSAPERATELKLDGTFGSCEYVWEVTVAEAEANAETMEGQVQELLQSHHHAAAHRNSLSECGEIGSLAGTETLFLSRASSRCARRLAQSSLSSISAAIDRRPRL